MFQWKSSVSDYNTKKKQWTEAIMFHYGKAYSIIFSFTGSLMPRLPENYWLLGRSLPDLLAPSTSGKAELASDDILTSKSHLNKTLVRGDPYPTHPGADFPKQDRWDLHGPVRIYFVNLDIV